MKTDLRSILEMTALAAALTVPGCDDGNDAGEDASTGSAESTGASAGCPGATAGCPGTTAGCPGTSAGCPGTTAGCPGTSAGCPGTTAGCPSAERPAEVEAVIAAIEDESYLEWEGQSEPAPPVGNSPHPGEVRTFFNATLAASMGTDTAAHPVGSAAIKESWMEGELAGWFIEVKVAEGEGVETWYWWSDLAGVDALGGDDSVAGCTGCHAAGFDYVTTIYPFE